MVYVLTSENSSKGWGKPLAVFKTKEDVYKYILNSMKASFKTKEESVVVDSSYNKEDKSHCLTAISFNDRGKCTQSFQAYSFHFDAEKNKLERFF